MNNKKLQKTALTFSHSMTSYLRHAAKSDLKGLCVVRDLSEQKGILLVRLLKFAWPKGSTTANASHFAYLNVLYLH